jgi:hypothetical protein
MLLENYANNKNIFQIHEHLMKVLKTHFLT